MTEDRVQIKIVQSNSEENEQHALSLNSSGIKKLL